MFTVIHADGTPLIAGWNWSEILKTYNKFPGSSLATVTNFPKFLDVLNARH